MWSWWRRYALFKINIQTKNDSNSIKFTGQFIDFDVHSSFGCNACICAKSAKGIHQTMNGHRCEKYFGNATSRQVDVDREQLKVSWPIWFGPSIVRPSVHAMNTPDPALKCDKMTKSLEWRRQQQTVPRRKTKRLQQKKNKKQKTESTADRRKNMNRQKQHENHSNGTHTHTDKIMKSEKRKWNGQWTKQKKIWKKWECKRWHKMRETFRDQHKHTHAWTNTPTKSMRDEKCYPFVVVISCFSMCGWYDSIVPNMSWDIWEEEKKIEIQGEKCKKCSKLWPISLSLSVSPLPALVNVLVLFLFAIVFICEVEF